MGEGKGPRPERWMDAPCSDPREENGTPLARAGPAEPAVNFPMPGYERSYYWLLLSPLTSVQPARSVAGGCIATS
jgi:hypothetical protein